MALYKLGKPEQIQAICVELTPTQRGTGFMASFKNSETGSREFSRLFYREGEIAVGDEVTLWRWSGSIHPVQIVRDRNTDRERTVTYRTIQGLSKSESDITVDASRSAMYYYDNADFVDALRGDDYVSDGCLAAWETRDKYLAKFIGGAE